MPLYWAVTGTHQARMMAFVHIVPGTRQADVIPGVCTLRSSELFTRRHPIHPDSALIFHPREMQAPWSQIFDTDSYVVPFRQR